MHKWSRIIRTFAGRGHRRTLLHSGVWLGFQLLLVADARADEPCAPGDDVVGYMQYFVDRQQLQAWRSDPGNPDCVWLDWPEQRQLSTVEAGELRSRLDAAQRQTRSKLGAISVRAVSPETRRTLDFDGIPPQIRTSTAAPAACLAADRHLHQVQWSEGTPPFVLRLSPAPCPDSKGLVRAGSAVLLSPTIGVTAAHIVNGTDGHAHCRYRLTPAARPFAAGSQPYGRLQGRVVQHGETPEVRQAAATDHRVQIQADWAVLAVSPENDDGRLTSQPVWPVWIFGDTRDLGAQRVIKIGFPRGARFRALRQPGGSVSWLAESVCPQVPIREFGFESDRGDSGGPILELPQDHPQGWLQLHSWVSTGQQVNLTQPTTLGPRLDLALYERLLAALRQADVEERP